jgi:glycerophosphoryl diester phosphodiesterase
MAQPLIIAHRGASAIAPENTRAAFLLARDMGADGFECDVHLSKDGVPVVIHDDDLRRVARVKKRVCDLTLRRLRQCDVGSWFARRFSGERILTLEETLAVAGPDFTCMVELKESGEAARDRRLALKVAALLENVHATACSFSDAMCKALRAAGPALHVDLICNASLRQHWAAALQLSHGHGLSGLGVNFRHLTAARVVQAHATGLRVDAWTVNRAASVVRLARMGVDAIETDKPDLAMRALASAGFTA